MLYDDDKPLWCNSAFDELCTIRDHITLLEKASKYQAARLLRRVMTRLEHFFPSTLEGHDHYVYQCTPSCAVVLKNDPARQHAHIVTHQNIIQMLQIARKTNILIFLPAVFLWASGDSVDTYLSPDNEGWTHPEIATLLRGQRHLYIAARVDVFSALYSSSRNISENCQKPEACHKARCCLIGLMELGHQYDTIVHPFDSIESCIQRPEAAELCHPCKTKILETSQHGRARAWEHLPEYFGLPDWSALRSARDELLAER